MMVRVTIAMMIVVNVIVVIVRLSVVMVMMIVIVIVDGQYVRMWSLPFDGFHSYPSLLYLTQVLFRFFTIYPYIRIHL